ncbi:MAG: 4-(cytidine 5'-diphospho)-2-C-methyl-D-erythritol kinase [Gammaproteobacteria bacterium]|nr:MAG: 4-(cytidine 5'-diphospho)-2-C-methyl-D-erythritol kinase [Gammaproteobacteria bacterium]
MKEWLSPAKINLFLHITGQRSDGYHNLQTAFQFLDYSDTLTFEPTQAAEIKLVTAIEGVEHDSNLIVRAAKALQLFTNTPQGVLISLKKVLPMGGGLGGGSSNAATTLVALNELWQCQLSKDELAKIGLSLGADVPIFIHGHAAWAEGVGEKVTSINPDEPWYIVLVPQVHVSTAEIFSVPELTRDCKTMTIRGFLSGEGRNVCEQVVRRRYPPVAEALDWLASYAKPRMTGTGACVFAGFNSQVEAQQVISKLPSDWQGFIAKGCNSSPLYND